MTREHPVTAPPAVGERTRRRIGLRTGLAGIAVVGVLVGATQAVAAGRGAADEGSAAKLAEAAQVAAPPKVVVEGENWDRRTGVDTFPAPAGYQPTVSSTAALEAVTAADFGTLLGSGDTPTLELRSVAFNVYPDSAGTQPQVMWVVKVANGEPAPVTGSGPQGGQAPPAGTVDATSPCEWRIYVSASDGSVSGAHQTCADS